MKTTINNIIKNEIFNTGDYLQCWIKQIRCSKNIIFIEAFDGTNFSTIQLVCKDSLSNFEEISKLRIKAAISIKGQLVSKKRVEGNEFGYEINVSEFEILKNSCESYPLQKKEHTVEFLREISHIRGNSTTYQAVFSIRSAIFISINNFFDQENFKMVTSPIISSNDTEGQGEMFSIESTADDDFFNQSAFLSVSGQLHGEAFAQNFKNIYVLGPTFRSEKSNTPRHAAEFWMLEPESAFEDINFGMDLAEKFIKYVGESIKRRCNQELTYLSEKNDVNLHNVIENLIRNEFTRITYTEAIELLKEKVSNDKNFFDYNNIEWGMDLQTEHEKYITTLYKSPVFVRDYPKKIKSFYMKVNPNKVNNQETVAAFDLLVEGIGELIGGSQREDDYETLLQSCKDKNMDVESLKWYLELRKYGYHKSVGFGVGIERLVMLLTGTKNIKDAIPFARVFKRIYN